jgi:hypothetical protein
MDETLFHTFAKVVLLKKDGVTEELCNKKYITHRPDMGDVYMYDQFRDSDYFVKTSRPMEWLRHAEVTRNLKNAECVVITGRGNFDDNQRVINHFHAHGFMIEPENFHCVGDDEEATNTAHAKSRKIDQLLDNPHYWMQGWQNYNTVVMYDDHPANLIYLQYLSKEHKYAYVNFNGYLINGSECKRYPND